MRYSCRHCQRINFVELTQAHLGRSSDGRTSNRGKRPHWKGLYLSEGGGGAASMESLDHCPTTTGNDWPECCHLVADCGLCVENSSLRNQVLFRQPQFYSKCMHTDRSCHVSNSSPLGKAIHKLVFCRLMACSITDTNGKNVEALRFGSLHNQSWLLQ